MVGCYGNKGIIFCILFIEDMFYFFDGCFIDIVFNFLGVFFWMNVGQVFECLLGWVGENFGVCFKIIFFDEMYGEEVFWDMVYGLLEEVF